MKMNKKYLLPLLLILIVCLSISAISAADNSTDTTNIASSNSDVAVASSNTNDVIGDGSTPTTYSVNNTQSVDDIQNTITNAADGDTINFETGNYIFNKTGLTINHNLTLNGNNATINILTGESTSVNGFTIDEEGSGSTITGFNLIFTNDNGTNENGCGVSISNAGHVTVDNSNFINGKYGVSSTSSNNITISNSNFTGIAITVAKNGKEVGTKSVSFMSTSDSTVENCYFYDDVLDGVSIASNSRNNNIINNTFLRNEYGIFFGGGVTYTNIINNSFVNCTAMSISNAKSQTTRNIKGNTFYILVGNYTSQSGINSTGLRPAIYINIGNTAHGSASRLANFSIDDNRFFAQYTNDSNPEEKAIAIQIESNGGGLEPSNNSYFNVTNNIVGKNVNLLTFTDANATNSTIAISDPVSKSERINTTIVSADFKQVATDFYSGERGGYFNVTLKDQNGNVLANKPVSVGFNGVVYNLTTDANGVARLQINLAFAGDYTFAIAFLGDDEYNGFFAVNKITIVKKSSYLALSGNTPAKVNVYKTLKVTLTSQTSANPSKKMAVANKKVTVTVNGKTYTATTNSNGVAYVKVKINRAGTYTITTKFAGNAIYGAKQITSKIVVRR
ncbi:MAG: right-handed parallel beta-helix repeat-containing protein [Methanobrevibacter sp.]